MMSHIKVFINQLRTYLWNYVFTYIPFHRIRCTYFRLILQGKLGKDSWLLMGVKVKAAKKISIGNNCVVNSGVLLDGRGGLSIGDNVDIATGVLLWTMTHDAHDPNHSAVQSKLIIDEYVWIGARCQVMPGAHIGCGAVLGAGSIVVKDVAEFDIVGGVPSRIIGRREQRPTYELNHCPWFE